ncbi:hypothetical protein GCK32_022223, partial [Trichostrongylus colubriformis]
RHRHMWQDAESCPTKCNSLLSFPSIDEGGQGLLRRVSSLQFISKKMDPIAKKVRAYVKIRYKDVAKFIIWRECRLEDRPKNRLKVIHFFFEKLK